MKRVQRHLGFSLFRKCSLISFAEEFKYKQPSRDGATESRWDEYVFAFFPPWENSFSFIFGNVILLTSLYVVNLFSFSEVDLSYVIVKNSILFRRYFGPPLFYTCSTFIFSLPSHTFCMEEFLSWGWLLPNVSLSEKDCFSYSEFECE